jgi:hypothetical protein
MRKPLRDLLSLTGAMESYERGRRLFREGASFTELPLSSQSTVRSGWLDELADCVQDPRRLAAIAGDTLAASPTRGYLDGEAQRLTADGDPLPAAANDRPRGHAGEADE